MALDTLASLCGPKHPGDPMDLKNPKNPRDPKNPRSPCVDLKMLKLEIIEKIDTPARVCAQRSINIVICQTLFKTFTFGTFKDFFYFLDFLTSNTSFTFQILKT